MVGSQTNRFNLMRSLAEMVCVQRQRYLRLFDLILYLNLQVYMATVNGFPDCFKGLSGQLKAIFVPLRHLHVNLKLNLNILAPDLSPLKFHINGSEFKMYAIISVF